MFGPLSGFDPFRPSTWRCWAKIHGTYSNQDRLHKICILHFQFTSYRTLLILFLFSYSSHGLIIIHSKTVTELRFMVGLPSKTYSQVTAMGLLTLYLLAPQTRDPKDVSDELDFSPN